MAFALALLSSALWGSADFQAGRMSKKYKAFAVLGITQLIGLAFGIFLIFATGERDAVAFGNYGFNRWIYRTRNLRRLKTPVPAKGMQCVGWTVPPDVEAKVLAQL